MKLSLAILATIFSWSVLAGIVDTSGGKIYLGEELYQGQRTGGTCYLQVQEVNQLDSKGMHCTEILTKFGFTTKNKKHVKEVIRTVSRITNYQSAEYPRLKTCAEKVSYIPRDISDYITIYESDDTYLYNQLFSWNKKINGMDQHFFITFSSETKQPKRLRLHGRTWFSEKNWDCLNLIDASPK